MSVRRAAGGWKGQEAQGVRWDSSKPGALRGGRGGAGGEGSSEPPWERSQGPRLYPMRQEVAEGQKP